VTLPVSSDQVLALGPQTAALGKGFLLQVTATIITIDFIGQALAIVNKQAGLQDLQSDYAVLF